MRFTTAIVILPATFATVFAGPSKQVTYGNFKFMYNCNKYVGSLKEAIEDANQMAVGAFAGLPNTDAFAEFMDASKNPIRGATVEQRLRMIANLTDKEAGAIGDKSFIVSCDIHSRTKKDLKKCRQGSLYV